MNKREEIEKALAELRPSLGGADVQFEDDSEGVVTIRYYRPLANPSACHVDRTKITKDMVAEMLEDMFKERVPELRRVILIGEQ